MSGAWGEVRAIRANGEEGLLITFWILLKLLDFYPGDLRWGSDPIRSMFEKDYCIGSVKDRSDRDLKQEEHLIDRRDAKSSIVHISEPSKMFIELK